MYFSRVASPRLLDANLRTAEQMQVVNTMCRFDEVAEVGWLDASSSAPARPAIGCDGVG